MGGMNSQERTQVKIELTLSPPGEDQDFCFCSTSWEHHRCCGHGHHAVVSAHFHLIPSSDHQ